MILNMDKIQFESKAEIGTILNNPARRVGRGCSRYTHTATTPDAGRERG